MNHHFAPALGQVLDGDLERMQSLHRASKSTRNTLKHPTPPPLQTPFDAVDDVEMTLRVLTDSGEEHERALAPSDGAGGVEVSFSPSPSLVTPTITEPGTATGMDRSAHGVRK